MRILTHLLVGICMLIGFSFSANAEKLTASIKGKVIDVNSKEPIPYATVALEGSSVGAVTNFEGEFVIEDVPMGHYHVVASCVGYQIKTKEWT